MPAELEFTGERFLPGAPGAIAYEHWHRYAFALRWARGRRVLDAACGEGYGTALLASAATSVAGVDIDPDAIDHARRAYTGVTNLRYDAASVIALPLADASVDVVVSFETIEHLPAADQPRMLSEFARVLTPKGVLVISSPNRVRYSEARDYHNPYHLHELDRDELARLLDSAFPQRRWYHQAPLLASALWSEEQGNEVEAWSGNGRSVRPATPSDGMYYLVVASKADDASPSGPRLSLFHDDMESELKRAEAAAAEVLRLDALLLDRDTALAKQAAHVAHLEALVAFREHVVEERDGELAACNTVRESHEHALVAARDRLASTREALLSQERAFANAQDALSGVEAEFAALQREHHRIESALAAQERMISHQQSWRWWMRLPWMRARLWWQRQKDH